MNRPTVCLLVLAALLLTPLRSHAQGSAEAPTAEASAAAASEPTPAPASATQPPAAPASAPTQHEGPAAEAEPEEGFGKAGVINLASDLSLSIDNTSYSAPSGASPKSITSYTVGPAADVFVIDNLSVGAQLLLGHSGDSSLAEGGRTTLRIAPRVGYHISFIPERLGLWPRVELGYASTTIKVAGLPESTEKTVVLGLFVPLLIHPAEHFHIGIGPFCETDLSAKEDDKPGIKATTLGLRTEIAGWWLL